MAKAAEKYETKNDEKIFNISYLVLGVLIFLTLGITYNFFMSAKSKDAVRFDNQVRQLTATIDSRVKLYTAMLKGGRGFIETSKELNRENFSAYISSLDLQNRYPGIQGIGFSSYFAPAEKDALIARMKAEGYADFSVFPEGERPVYTSIIYLEPLSERNKFALGFDMFSEQIRREAMTRARDTGDAAASGKVALIQEKDDESPSGFLIYLPVYKSGAAANSPAQREENLLGFIYIPFRARNFINEIYEEFPEKDVGIRIYDARQEAENLLAETEAGNQPKTVGWLDEAFVANQEIDIAGRTWVLEYYSLSGFAAQSSVSWTPLIFLCGMAFTFLLFGMTYWEAASRAKVQKTAAKLFELQKEKEKLFEDEKQARRAAEQANSTKDEFIAIVSHELKTPLNAIAGWARILKTEDVSIQTRQLALQKIDKNLRAQAGLVEQLLNYSEIISGKTGTSSEKFDFSEIFEQSCDEIEPLASEKKIEFLRLNSLDKHAITGDREKLKIALVNLLANAVKFTPNGGAVKAAAEADEEFLTLTITDNGRGISPEFLPFVFERYKQADTSTTRNFGGLGLGLTISKHIFNLSGGTITAESGGVNKGATFIVKLPLGE